MCDSICRGDYPSSAGGHRPPLHPQDVDISITPAMGIKIVRWNDSNALLIYPGNTLVTQISRGSTREKMLMSQG